VSLVELWLRAFAISLAVELAIGVPLLRERGWPVRVAAVAVANLASHPILWFVLLRLGLSFEVRHVLAEAWAIGVELGIYVLVFPAIGVRRAAAVSLLANGASLGVGIALRALGVAI
jgi:hypothetical protein